jgi:hypothetical protein
MSELVARSRILGPLYAYWSSKAAAGHLPHRRDIDPVDIPALLPNLHFVYRDEAGDFRFGMTGGAVVSHYGTNVANKPFKEVLKGQRLAAAHRHHALAWDSRRALWARNRYFAEGLPECVVTRLLLPLAGNTGTVDAILVGSTFECTFLYYKELGPEWRIERASEELRFLDTDREERVEPATGAVAATRSLIRDLSNWSWRRQTAI